jgi:glutamine amidotransferase
VRFASAVAFGPVLATQFHPEKSGTVGLGLLRRWLETTPC